MRVLYQLKSHSKLSYSTAEAAVRLRLKRSSHLTVHDGLQAGFGADEERKTKSVV